MITTRQSTHPEKNAQDRQVVSGLCGVCPAGCGVDVQLVDGVIERISPIKGHPQGVVCPRGMCADEIVYSPDRLLYPQVRSGERGAGRFERLSWEQAYAQIVEKMKAISSQYGPEALAVYTGRGNFEYGLNEHFAPAGTVESSANAVLFPFGSPNATGVGSLCYVSYGMIAPRACFGAYMRDMDEDLENADLILIWGDNPITDSSPIKMRSIKKAQRRGARVIVIDHRHSETARALDAEWIGIRPGTDGALALGALNLLLEAGLYDREFAENWTHGFDELRQYTRQFTPQEVERITWVPAERLRDLAMAIGDSGGCSILTYTGLEYSDSGVQAIRAVWTLQALSGHLDVPGGKLFRMPQRPRLNRLLTPAPPQSRPPVGSQEYPLYYQVRNEAHSALLPRAILEGEPYPVRGLIVSGSSLITSWPNPDIWRRALAALDLLVIVNRFPTADSQYADILLPATTMFEIESYMEYDGLVQLRPRIIQPVGESRSDYLIFAGLAERLGYGHLWPQSETGMIEHALQGTGIMLDDLRRNPDGIQLPQPEFQYRKYASGQLRRDGKPGFETPTGKFEIASEWFRQHGYEPLPVYLEPREGPLAAPELFQEYPLVFNSGARTQFTFRSQHHNIPTLVAKEPYPLVVIHPDDASTRGIQDGDPVVVRSARGRVPFRARVSDGILPGVVEVNQGGGGPLGPVEWQLGNVNDLTDSENREALSGFPVYKALLCQVEKAETNAPG